MESRKLFLVQDSDRPLYVLAESWQDALEKWRARIYDENPGLEVEWDPDGISLVADTNDIIF